MLLKGARLGDRHFIGRAVPCLQLMVITWRLAVNSLFKIHHTNLFGMGGICFRSASNAS
jgi:hypothetical protein